MQRVLAAACLFAVASPSIPLQAMEPATATPVAAVTEATVLAKLLTESTDVEVQVDRLLVGLAQQAFTADPDLMLVNRDYPGVDKLFLETLRPIMRDELYRILPAYRAATAEFFARNFTTSEIRDLTIFWRSPVGQAVLRQVSDKIDYSAITKEIVEQMPDGDVNISGAALNADKRKAATEGIRGLSPEHRAATIRFGLTPTGRKMTRLLPEKNALDREWANRPPSPEALARIETELPEALLAFMDAEDAKRAKKP